MTASHFCPVGFCAPPLAAIDLRVSRAVAFRGAKVDVVTRSQGSITWITPHEFPTEWYAIRPSGGVNQSLELVITKKIFPFRYARGRSSAVGTGLCARSSVPLSVMIDPPFDNSNPASGGTQIAVAVPQGQSV